MSTQPGRDAWRDAGVAEPDRHDREVRAADPDDATLGEVANLVEEALTGGSAPDATSAEDYRPSTPRPDLSGAADEADVAEQAEEVAGLDGDDYDDDGEPPAPEDFDPGDADDE